jgi:hypothetical protein
MEEKTIPQQLAAHIDEVCGLHNTGDVSSFFNEHGNLLNCGPMDSSFAFIVAGALHQYEPREHNSYIDNVSNMIQGDIDGLKMIQKAICEFKVPSLNIEIGNKVYWTDPDGDVSSGTYTVVDIKDEIFYLTDEHGSEVEAEAHELSL